jgi:hypothetical protein
MATPRLAEFSFKHSKADSPSRGVIFRLRISPRIRSQNWNGSKGSVRDLQYEAWNKEDNMERAWIQTVALS